MLRPILTFSALLIAAAPAAASSYSAKLATPANQRIIGPDIVWNCDSAACQGATDESRPAVLCQSLAKRAGRIESFIVDGRVFGPAELEQCNTAAKAQPNPVLAAH